MKLRFQFGFLPLLILLIGLGGILINVLSPRDIGMGDTFERAPANPIAVYVGMALTGIILAICSFKILFVTLKGRVPSGASGILFYYLLFFLCTVLITAVVGRGTFVINLLYAPIIFAAVYVARPMPTAQLMFLSKSILLVYVYGSLLAAVLVPSWALMGPYVTILPGVDTRLFGLSSQANQLGPLIAAYLAIEFFSPTRSRLRTIHLVAALFVLVWAQSKTSWVFVLLAIAYLVFIKIEQALFPQSNSRRHYAKIVFYCSGMLAGAVLIAGLINLVPVNSGTGIETLTGRTAIWAITLQAWADNPIFGYGLGLWDIDFRTKYGMPFAGQAHNQFIHTLGSSGLVGLFGLLMYLGALAKRAINIAKINPVALALLFLIVVECMTEAPLRNGNILTGFFFLQLLLFAQLRSDK